MKPQTQPRRQGLPRPLILPSSDRASANAIETPAPTDAASPTRNVGHVSSVAKAAAKIGASVDMEPSMRPARPGWTTESTNLRFGSSLLPRCGRSHGVGSGIVRSILLRVRRGLDQLDGPPLAGLESPGETDAEDDDIDRRPDPWSKGSQFRQAEGQGVPATNDEEPAT